MDTRPLLQYALVDTPAPIVCVRIYDLKVFIKFHVMALFRYVTREDSFEKDT